MSPRPAPRPPDDEQLVERLRETLRVEAEAVAPFTGRMRSIAAIHDWRERRRAARRRRAAAIVAIAAVAVIGVTAAVVANRPLHSTAVGVGGGPVYQPALHTKGRAESTKPAVITPAATSGPTVVPASFAPLSVTFVTSDIGYALGTVSCSAGRCLALASTDDGGGNWSDLGTPAPSGRNASVPATGPVHLSLRFSDQDHGWIYGHVDDQSVLWWTGDAGQSWTVAGAASTSGGDVTSLEAMSQRAEAAVVRAEPPQISLISSPQSSTTWHAVGPPLALANVKASTDLVLQGESGWFVENAPTFVAGARLLPSGQWVPWKPYCPTPSTVQLAAVTSNYVLELCQSASGTAGPEIYQSSDGGHTWSSRAQLSPGIDVEGFVAASKEVVAVAGHSDGQAVIELNEQDGADAATVWHGPGEVTQLGFENPQQGIAVVSEGGRAQLLMTTSSGQHWAPVDFQRAPPSTK